MSLFRRKALVFVAAALSLCVSPINAQGLDQSDPGRVALRHLRAMVRRDFKTSAALTLPEELARTRKAFQPIFSADPDGNITRRVMGDVKPADLPALTDIEFNARLFNFHVTLASQGTAFERFTDVDIFAVAQPHPDTAYVVWQWKLPSNERPIRNPNATMLVRYMDKWWLDMLTDFEGLRQLLARK